MSNKECDISQFTVCPRKAYAARFFDRVDRFDKKAALKKRGNGAFLTYVQKKPTTAKICDNRLIGLLLGYFMNDL